MIVLLLSLSLITTSIITEFLKVLHHRKEATAPWTIWALHKTSHEVSSILSYWDLLFTPDGLDFYNQDFGVETQQSAKHVLAAVPLADLNALALWIDLSQSRFFVLRALGNPSAPVMCWELCVQARWALFIPGRENLKYRNCSFWISVRIYYPRRQTSCFQPINFGPTQSTNYCKLQEKTHQAGISQLILGLAIWSLQRLK